MSEGAVLIAFFAVGMALLALLYVMNIGTAPAIKYASTTTIPPQTTATTTIATTTTFPQSTTIQAETQTTLAVESTVTTPSTVSTTLTTASTTTLSEVTKDTQPALPDYLQKYSGRGYRQAYMEITFFCPSCVPAVAANLRATPGVIAKDMSYRQKLSWVIYDPKKVTLDSVLSIAGGNGEVTLISDREV